MRRCIMLAIAAALVGDVSGAATIARAAGSIPCGNFTKNADGSWTVLETTYIEGPDVKVQEHALVEPGRMVLGHDIAAMIAKACPNATVALPSDETPNLAPPSAPGMAPSAAPGAAPRAAPAQPTQSFLARYADANGNIDIRQFTCGHLNEASPEEAQLLLAWYSGWYKGVAKSRGINLARVRYNSRGVIDYCKANRDKKLTDVMELMLK
jgi:hypothetical protein